MEILARKKAENEKAALEQRLDQMQARVDQMEEQRTSHSNSTHGSNSQHHVNTRSNENGAVGNLEDHGEEGYASADDEYYDEEDQNLIGQMHTAAPPGPIKNRNIRNNDAPRFSHDALVGKDVILFALLRSDQPVAKGTIISTNPNAQLGGQPLGRKFCEVIVNVVMKRDAMLPRPYADMETMADAHMMSIAWPYKRLKVSNKALTPSHGTSAGS